MTVTTVADLASGSANLDFEAPSQTENPTGVCRCTFWRTGDAPLDPNSTAAPWLTIDSTDVGPYLVTDQSPLVGLTPRPANPPIQAAETSGSGQRAIGGSRPIADLRQVRCT